MSQQLVHRIFCSAASVVMLGVVCSLPSRALAPAFHAITANLMLSTGSASAFGLQAAADSGRYRDPHGRYSLDVPDGWKAEFQGNSGALQLSSGASWAMLLAGGGSVPIDVNHQVTQQIQAQFKDFQLLNEGDLQINGRASHGSTLTGINPKGERVSVLVLSINAGSGRFLTVISSSPNDLAKAVNATIVKMAQSIQFTGE